MQPCVCSGLRSFVPRPDKIPAERSPFPLRRTARRRCRRRSFRGKDDLPAPRRPNARSPEKHPGGLPDKRYPPRRTNSTARLPRTLLPHSRRFAPHIPDEHPTRQAPGRTSAPLPCGNAVKPDRVPVTSLLCFRCTHFVRKRSEIAEMRSRHRAAANSFASRHRHIVSCTGFPPAPASGNRSSRNGFSNPGQANLIRTSLRNIPNVFPPAKTTKRLLRSIARPETPDAPQRPPEQRTSYLPRHKHPVAAQRRIRIGKGERDRKTTRSPTLRPHRCAPARQMNKRVPDNRMPVRENHRRKPPCFRRSRPDALPPKDPSDRFG